MRGKAFRDDGGRQEFHDGSTIEDGVFTTEIGKVYFTPYEEFLVTRILDAGRLVSLEHLIASLYVHPREEPEWPEDAVKMLLSNARRKLKSVGRQLTESRGHGRGYRIEKDDGR